jgi:hypothetical protein
MMLTTFHACLVLSHAIIMYSQLIESHEIPPRIFWETRTYKQRNEHENYCLPGCAVWQLCTDASEESNASILYFEMKAGVSKEYVNGHQTTSDYSSFVFIIPFVNTSDLAYNKPSVFNHFCSRTPTYNLSSTLYPQSCWCIIQVIHSL